VIYGRVQTMPDTRELSSILSAAETAAAAGDFSAAAAALRQALDVQEATLGPSHPDLADTLNNLGVASERAKQLDEAERYYRRALAVATAAFPADHPFVATSLANLREFCDANGRPFEPPAAPPPKPQPVQPAPPKLERPPARVAAPAPVPAPGGTLHDAPARSLNPIAVGGAILIVIAIVVGFALRGGSESTAPPPPSPSPASPPPPAAPPPPAQAQGRAPAPASGRAATSPAPGQPSLVNARLCRRLVTDEGTWNCEPAVSPVSPGSLTFLTRIRSARNTTVQHRWYRGQDLVRSASLEITASPTEGYRTYSRFVVTAGNAEWRIELRASDGTLLHEERFVVR
jgi:hypothetical protein